MSIVTLRNGAQESDATVSGVCLLLNALIEREPDGHTVIFDLREACENRGDFVDERSRAILKKLHLVDADGRVPRSIKNIVLSSVDGDRLDIHLVSPVAEEIATPTTAPANDQDAVMDTLRDGGTIRYYYLAGGYEVVTAGGTKTDIACSPFRADELRNSGVIENVGKRGSGQSAYLLFTLNETVEPIPIANDVPAASAATATRVEAD